MFIYKTRQKNAGRTKNKTTTPTAVAAFLRKQDKHREPINVELLSQLPPRLKKKKERKNRSPKPLAGVFRSAPPINQTSSSPLVFFSSLKQSRFFTWLTQGKKEPQHYANSWHRHFEHTDKDSKKKKGRICLRVGCSKRHPPPLSLHSHYYPANNRSDR